MGNRGCWVVVTSSTWNRINGDIQQQKKGHICATFGSPHLAGVDKDALDCEVRPRAVHQPSAAAGVQNLQNRAQTQMYKVKVVLYMD